MSANRGGGMPSFTVFYQLQNIKGKAKDVLKSLLDIRKDVRTTKKLCPHLIALHEP